MNAWRNVYPILILFKRKVHIGTYSPVQKSSDKLCSEFTIKLVKRLLSMAVHSMFEFDFCYRVNKKHVIHFALSK